jgi:hypothetical protein
VFHVGQVVQSSTTGEKFIYWGLSVDVEKDPECRPSGTYFVGKDHKVVGAATIPEGVVPIENVDEEIFVGRFCIEMGLVGHFIGVIDEQKLTEENWRLVDETLAQEPTE